VLRTESEPKQNISGSCRCDGYTSNHHKVPTHLQHPNKPLWFWLNLQSNTHHYLSYCALAIIFSSLPTFQISLNNSWSLGINLSQIHHSLYSIMHAVSHSLALPIQLYLPLRPNLYNCLFKVLSLCLLGHERVTHSGYPEKQVCHRSCW
jgi:hypothetical protein